MSNLTLTDNGVYTCEVETPFETITSQVAVRVSGEPPRILSDFKKIVVYEGESMEIRCLVRGVPRPTLTWYVVSYNCTLPALTSSSTTASFRQPLKKFAP